MIRFTHSPLGRGIVQALVVLGGFVVLAFSGIVDCDFLGGSGTGPVDPNPGVAALIALPSGPIQIGLGQTVEIRLRAVDQSGGTVAGSGANIRTGTVPDGVEVRLEGVASAPEERVAFVTGRAVGSGTIGFFVSGVSVNATVAVQVVTTPPAAAAVPGGYSITGSRRPPGPGTCAVMPGLADPGLLGISVETVGGQTFLTVITGSIVPLPSGPSSATFVVRGPYDPATGSWRGEGAALSPEPAPAPDGRQIWEGTWTLDGAGGTLFVGTVTVEAIRDGAVFCRVIYDVTLRREVDVPSIARLDVQPAVLRLGATTGIFNGTFTVRAVNASGAAVPGTDIHIAGVVRAADASIVEITSRTDATPGDGTVVFEVMRRTAGVARVAFSYPGVTAVEGEVIVSDAPPAPAGRVVSVHSAATMQVGLTTVLLARVRDLTTGALVIGSDPFVTARSSNEAVATVVSKSEGVPNDGEVEFTIRGNSAGSAVISFSYPGSTDDTTLLTVSLSVDHPTLAEIAPGNYIFRKQSTVLGCSGTVTQSNDPATATNVGGVNPLRLQTFFTAPPPSGATTSTVQGPYNDADGTYIANGTDDFGNVHELNGHWTVELDGDPRFDGTLVERKFSPTCQNTHAVTYTVD